MLRVVVVSEGALEKSARAAGLSQTIAERYASDMVKKLPGMQPRGRWFHCIYMQ